MPTPSPKLTAVPAWLSFCSLGHFTMHYSILILFIVATSLVGCHSPTVISTQTAAPLSFRSMFVTTLGTNTTLDGSWRVAVSETSLDLSHMRGGGWTTTAIPAPTKQAVGWTPTHAGWLVFAESESRVWAYDGDRLLVLHTYESSGNNSHEATYFDSRFPSPVPSEVYSRLSEPAQKASQLHE